MIDTIRNYMIKADKSTFDLCHDLGKTPKTIRVWRDNEDHKVKYDGRSFKIFWISAPSRFVYKAGEKSNV